MLLPRPTRRALLWWTGAGCVSCSGNQMAKSRLFSRPSNSATNTLQGGTTHKVPVPGGRPALLYVPPKGSEDLVVSLHGAGGDAERGLALLVGAAQRHAFA